MSLIFCDIPLSVCDPNKELSVEDVIPIKGATTDSSGVTQELLKTLFMYSEGKLLRIKAVPKSPIGSSFGSISQAGGRDSRGFKKQYLKGWVCGKFQYVHRLIWLYHYGVFPVSVLDHVDHNTLNNHIENLVETDIQGNCRNQNKAKNNTSGYTGVVFDKVKEKFVAQLHVKGSNIFLGYFPSAELAAEARKRANAIYGFNPNHGLSLTKPGASI